MLQKFKPLFKDQFVPIVFACSNEFVPYLCTTLKSMIKHLSPYTNYEINIIEQNFTEETKKIINNTIGNIKNLRYRIFSLNEYMKKNIKYFELLKKMPSPPVVYAPIFFEEFFSEYSKIIFMDSDMILHSDIGEIYEINLDNKSLAGVLDFTLIYAVKNNLVNNVKNLDDYYKNILKLNINKYINTGIYILDIKKWKEKNFSHNAINILQKENLLYADQDLINIIFKNDIKFISPIWNFQHAYEDENFIKSLGDDLYKKYFRDFKSPLIYHYCCKRITQNQLSPLEICFWQYAKQTPFYEYLLYERLVKPNIPKINIQKNKKKYLKYYLYSILNFLTFGLYEEKVNKYIEGD